MSVILLNTSNTYYAFHWLGRGTGELRRELMVSLSFPNWQARMPIWAARIVEPDGGVPEVEGHDGEGGSC
jgi:hypothetical protein